jgi:acyl carrier protein
MEKDTLKLELKQHIIKYLNLLEMTPDKIGDDQPLFGEGGLGLDSIDSIELIVLLEREYGIKIQDPKEGRKILVDVNTIADYVIQNRTTQKA